MSRNSDSSNVSRRHFLAVAGSVAAASSVGVRNASSAAPAATTTGNKYPMTIDVSQSPIVYSCVDPVTGVKAPAYRLTIPTGAGNTVTWNITSSGPTQKHCSGIFFPNDTPFVDLTGRPVYGFVWSEREEAANQVTLNVDAAASGTYEYRIVVRDIASGTTYSEDPKIIVGTGGIELITELRAIKAKLEEEAKSTPPEVQKKLEPIEKELGKVIDELK